MQDITIKFLEDCVPKDGSGRKYKEGQTETMPYASAMHWIKRRKAVDASEGVKVPEPVKPDQPKLSNAAEERHEENMQKRGRTPRAVSTTNEAFSTGDDA